MTRFLILLISAVAGFAVGCYCGKKGFSEKKTICIIGLVVALVEFPLLALNALSL